VGEVVRRRLGIAAGDALALRADLHRLEHFDVELLDVVRDLKPRARQAIVSNAWGGTRRRLQALGLDALFDAIVISAEVGASKPSPDIFQIALGQLEVSPAACIFIDDAPENVESATALGMAGYRHHEPRTTATWVRSQFAIDGASHA
jgi:putative hydrolase of the HAD superfamily